VGVLFLAEEMQLFSLPQRGRGTAAAVAEENVSPLISSAFPSGEGGPLQRWMRRTFHRLSPLFNSLALNPR